MYWPQFVNTAGVVLAASLTHLLAERVRIRVAPRLRGSLPTDSWILYMLFYTGILLVAFHILGMVALATGVNLVHVTTLTGLLFTAWLASRMLDRRASAQGSALTGYSLIDRLARGCRAVLPDGRIERWILLIAIAVYLVFTLEAATRPPTGWDGVVYHLPLAAKWFQNGNLNFLTESWKFQMPANGELLLLFLMYLGEDRILSLAFLPFALFGMVLVYSFGRRLSASHDSSVLAAVGFGTTPIILFNTFAAYIDLFGAVFLLCATYFVLWWVQEKAIVSKRDGSVYIILAGLAAGVALGSKYTFVPLTAVLVGLVGLCAFAERGRHVSDRIGTALRQSLCFFGSSLVPSTYWYLRNLIKTGNPFHPIQVAFSGGMPRVSGVAMNEGKDLLPELLCGGLTCNRLGHWIMRPWTEFQYAGEYFSINMGLGPIFATFVPLALLVTAVVMLVIFLRQRRVPALALPVFMVTFTLGYWWFYVYRRVRLTLHTLGFAFPLVAYCLGLFSGERQRVAVHLFLYAMIANAVLLAVNPLGSLGSRLYHNSWSRSVYYGVPHAIDALPPNSVVLNAAHELKNYALFGRNKRNRVVTSRALVEPEKVTRISEAFIKKWQVDYIFYASNQDLVLEDAAKYEIVHRDVLKSASGQFEEIVYKTNRTPTAPEQNLRTARPGQPATKEGE